MERGRTRRHDQTSPAPGYGARIQHMKAFRRAYHAASPGGLCHISGRAGRQALAMERGTDGTPGTSWAFFCWPPGGRAGERAVFSALKNRIRFLWIRAICARLFHLTAKNCQRDERNAWRWMERKKRARADETQHGGQALAFSADELGGRWSGTPGTSGDIWRALSFHRIIYLPGAFTRFHSLYQLASCFYPLFLGRSGAARWIVKAFRRAIRRNGAPGGHLGYAGRPTADERV
jgi:hypothetical protein